MKKILFFLLVIFSSCNNDKFAKIKQGMSPIQVIELVGQPSDSVVFAKTSDSISIKIWNYGTEKRISFINNKVDNVMGEKEIKELKEKARLRSQTK